MRPRSFSHPGGLLKEVRACETRPDSDEEARFVVALKQRCPEAWSRLYAECHPGIYRYIRGRVGGQDADDLTATVFVQAYEAISSFSYRGIPVVAWLQRIARNLVAGHMRRHKPVTSFDETMESQQSISGPEEQVVLREDLLAVETALLCLKNEERMVISLRFLGQLNHREIAVAMGRSPGAVRVLQHRALRHLRGRMSLERTDQSA